MLAVKGIYDGKNIVPIEKISEKKRFKVVITFVEELSSAEEDARAFASDSDAFSFWENEKEDIYQDFIETKTRSK